VVAKNTEAVAGITATAIYEHSIPILDISHFRISDRPFVCGLPQTRGIDIGPGSFSAIMRRWSAHLWERYSAPRRFFSVVFDEPYEFVGTLTGRGGMYALLRERTIVYIGFSSSIPARIYSHVQEKHKLFDRVWWLSGLEPPKPHPEREFSDTYRDWWPLAAYSRHPNGDIGFRMGPLTRNAIEWRLLESAMIRKFSPSYNAMSNRLPRAVAIKEFLGGQKAAHSGEVASSLEEVVTVRGGARA